MLAFMTKASFEEEPLFPYDCVVQRGITIFFVNSTPEVQLQAETLMYASFSVLFFSHYTIIGLTFVYRFAQTTGRNFVVSCMSNRWTVVFYGCLFVVLCVAEYHDATEVVIDMYAYRAAFGRPNPMVADYIADKFILAKVVILIFVLTVSS